MIRHKLIFRLEDLTGEQSPDGSGSVLDSSVLDTPTSVFPRRKCHLCSCLSLADKVSKDRTYLEIDRMFLEGVPARKFKQTRFDMAELSGAHEEVLEAKADFSQEGHQTAELRK
jgi:hypothetical protein